MFGYVVPPLGLLPREERERFRRMYCGLCRTLGQRCGQESRLILNYDFTFLAILLSGGTEPETERHRCPASPVHRRECCAASPALELAADESVILARWQAKDGVADHGALGGLKYRAASAGLHRAYRRAAEARPDFDQTVREQLALLAELERERCPSLDRPADAFARILAAAAEGIAPDSRRRVLGQMLYHLGRWVYLIDAADDLKEDFASGGYNPLRYRYGLAEGALEGEDRAAFASTLDHSVRMIATAYELEDFGCWSQILSQTIYSGLFQVGRAVLDGTFRRATKIKREETT